jgi:HEAT repeat protein
MTRLADEDGRDAVCAALARVLRDGVDIHRCLAAQALGHIGSPLGVAALVAALLDEDEDVRVDAAGALARLAPAEAEKPLLENLVGDPSTEVKLGAIDALVRLRSAGLVPWLRPLLKGRDDGIAWDETDYYQGGWDDWLDIQVKAVEALAEFGVEDAVPGIVEAMNVEDGQDLTEIGFKALARLGTPGIEALARYLAEGDERRRRRVAAVLAACDAPAAQTAVARALEDPSKDVRLAAARVLASNHPEDDRLAVLFSDPDPEMRAEMVRLCGREHAEFLAALLDEGTAPVAPAVLDLLTETPDLLARDAVVETIRSLLSGPETACATAAAVALAAVAGEAAFEDLNAQLHDTARPEEVRLAAVKGLARLGGEAAALALANVLGDDTRQVRLAAMAALVEAAAAGESWPNPAGETLLAALRGELIAAPEAEPEAPPEDAAAEAETDDEAASEDDDAESEPAFPMSTLQSMLGEKAPPLASPERGTAPVELTQDDLDRLALSARTPKKRVVPVTPQVAPHQDVRRFAARALGDLPRAEVACALAQALGEDDTELRAAAADSLARIAGRMETLPDEAADALLGGLIAQEREVRLSAIRGLGRAGGPGTARVLRDQLRDPDSFVRAETVRALAELGVSEPKVEALLRDPDPGVRLAAAEAVAGGENAVDLLVDFTFAFEGYHRRAAARLLRGLDAAAASRRFVAALGDAERLRFWPVAIEALEELNRGDAAPRNGSKPNPTQHEGAGV